MARTGSNQEYADIVLRILASMEIGASTDGVALVVKAVREGFPDADEQTILDIIGLPGGLRDRGLVAAKILFGNGGHVADMVYLVITNAGRAYVEKHPPVAATQPQTVATQAVKAGKVAMSRLMKWTLAALGAIVIVAIEEVVRHYLPIWFHWSH